MATWNPVRAFNDFAARSPARWQQAACVLIAVFLPVSAWQDRGAIVGLIAFAVYTPLFLVGAFRHARVLAWSARRPVLDAALFVPLVFVPVATLTDLSLAVCALIALGVGALLTLLVLRRTRARAGG
ncbi:MAG TPA: hypothetical protein VN238_10705 [Solirubrobacteraceae bacterium]|nr:hypothetical protein [Solirubrobacteraceae bacterium]